jgi:tetratricopeptide (TPR) repeat protein
MQINRIWLFVVLLLGAVIALYGQFLWNPIIFDDLPFFMLDNAGNQPISTYHFSPLELRSLPYATLAWSKSLFGLELFHFRVENLLLHAAVVLALFFFLAKLFAAVCGDQGKNELSTRSCAFFAALLFALHPVSSYAAGYLIQRTIVMATLFCLISMLTYVQGSVKRKPLWLWMSVLFYLLAVFCKEHAIMLPAVLLILTILLHDDWHAKIKQRWGIFASLAVIAVYVISLKSIVGAVYELNAPEMLLKNSASLQESSAVDISYPLSILTQTWLFFKYALLWVFPNPNWMSIDMREPFARTLFSSYLLASIGFVAWGVAAFWLLLKRGRSGLAGFAMLFPWVMFFTEFSTVRIQEVFVLYRSYLWAVGAFCLLPVIFAKLDGRTATFILAAIALAMVPISMERLETLSNPILLWSDAEKLVHERTDMPGAYRIYYNRGTELIKIGNQDQAIADLKLSVALSKDFAEAYGNLGAAYMKKGDWDNAVASFSKAIEIIQKNGKLSIAKQIYGRATSYEKMGMLEKAQNDYKESCRLINKGCEKTSLVPLDEFKIYKSN